LATLKSGTNADSSDGGSVDIYECRSRRTECLLLRRIDHLQISRCAQPTGSQGCSTSPTHPGGRDEVQILAQEGNESTAELGSCDTHAETVLRAARHDSFATDPRKKSKRNGVRVAVGSRDREEHADAMLGVVGTLPEVLIEVITDGPAAALMVGRLGRREIRKQLREDLLEARPGIRR
jgi:hypothetical protein